MKKPRSEVFDLFVIGGGVNGCGVARDAAGRGMRVGLAEMHDLGWATSSSSTKLFHGGLRYLEYFEFRLVREALLERERLLRAMPHISWPMRFVLPYHPDMRFEATTPTSKLLSRLMPWTNGRRPAWLIRLGLFLYDHMGHRELLPPTASIDLRSAPEGAPLKRKFRKAYEYSDCWIEDSRLVVLNARDAVARGASIMTRTKVTDARREGELWRINLDSAGRRETVFAKSLVNAAGPWVEDVVRSKLRFNSRENVRLVRGSHIVTRKLYDHAKCYFFQGNDGRIIFAIPYEQDFTLIGTTDVEHTDPDSTPKATEEEQAYLRAFASQYFEKPLTPDDVVWSYSGVRPLYDDGADSASAATRDYVLSLDANGPPLLNVFGGKITTYRKLAEHALEKLSDVMPVPGVSWTAGVALPGGDFPVSYVSDITQNLRDDYPFLSADWAARLIRAYGHDAWNILGCAKDTEDLGRSFGATLSESEVIWLCEKEYAQTAEDVLWRRSKLGLRMNDRMVADLESWFAARVHNTAAAE